MVREIKIYVEGDRALRKGFNAFFEKAYGKGIINTIPCGPGEKTAKIFFKEVKNSSKGVRVLLVDAEGSDKEGQIYTEFKRKWSNEWEKTLSEAQINFMVELMESWFLADPQALSDFYGEGFRSDKLPKNPWVEKIPKADVKEGLKASTRDARKGGYDKHKAVHAGQLLERLDPTRVRQTAPDGGGRLFVFLDEVLKGSCMAAAVGRDKG